MSEEIHALSCDLTIYHVGEIQKKLAKGLSGSEGVHIDAGKVGDLDMTGVQMLLSLKKTAETSGKPFRIFNLSEHCIRTLRKAGIDPDFFS